MATRAAHRGIDRVILPLGTHSASCYQPGRMTVGSAETGRVNQLNLEAIVQCPETGQPLVQHGATFATADGARRYLPRNGIPDLQRPPQRFVMNVPWYEPWEDLDAMRSDPPAPLEDPELPYHLDGHQLAMIGREGRGRSVVEIGCGERQCEAYLTTRDFSYVGIDVDHRGIGPNVFADAHNLPFKSETFDLALSMAVFQHLPNPMQAAQEAFRVLKPGGMYMATAAFVYGWTDRASFFHMSHGALLMILKYAGFENIRVWPDWTYSASIPNMSFSSLMARPWRRSAELTLSFLEWSYTQTAEATRSIAGKPPLSSTNRDLKTAGSLTFVAYRPRS